MPIYTYRCKECGYQFERRQRMSDDPLTICPSCEGGIRRVVNSVGVVFKGSGFYVTDNRGSNSADSKKTATSADKNKKPKSKSSAADSNKAASSATAAA
ncbi:MAG: hypothetical protein GY805_28465 [Chloroflexi bacterium]|nr:hypothetical protein [Chloroflexota bacterium]